MTLKSIREEAGYTIEEFAEILKLQPYGLQLLEGRGASGSAALRTFRIYCKKAGVDPMDYLSDDDRLVSFSLGKVEISVVSKFKSLCKDKDMTHGVGLGFLVDFYLENV